MNSGVIPAALFR